MIKFTFFYLVDAQYPEVADEDYDPSIEQELECVFQNVTIKDLKSKRQGGPYCGDSMPPSYLSDSHKIEIDANGGVIPNGLFYKGYAFTYKAVDAKTKLPKQSQGGYSDYSSDYGNYNYGSAFYDYSRPRRPPPRRPPPRRPPQTTADPYGAPRRPSLMRTRPLMPMRRPQTTFAPGSDPEIEYGEMPPQWDNPFGENDYKDYDYDTYEYRVQSNKPKPKKPKAPQNRRPIQSKELAILELGGTYPNHVQKISPGFPVGDIEIVETRKNRTELEDVVAKKLWSDSAVQRPLFIMADGSDGEPPFVPPGYDEIFHNPPIEHKPWEAEFYREKFEKLFQEQNFLIGCGVAAAVIVLIVIGTIVHCVLRCSTRRLDKQNEKLALEIRKKKRETLERKKQILQMRAESEEIRSANHEAFHIEDSDTDSEPSMSIIPENNGKPISINKRNDDTLKRITSRQSAKDKPMFKNGPPTDQPNLKIIKKQAPPPPGAATTANGTDGDASLVEDETKQEDNSIGNDTGSQKGLNEESKVTISTIQDENDMTHVTESFVQSSMAPSNMTAMTESVTTITDMAKSKLAMNSYSTVATEKSVKIISELENLEKKKQEDDNSQDENVDARIEDLQNQLLELLN